MVEKLIPTAKPDKPKKVKAVKEVAPMSQKRIEVLLAAILIAIVMQFLGVKKVDVTDYVDIASWLEQGWYLVEGDQ